MKDVAAFDSALEMANFSHGSKINEYIRKILGDTERTTRHCETESFDQLVERKASFFADDQYFACRKVACHCCVL